MKAIARVVIVSLVLGNVVWAQAPVAEPLKPWEQQAPVIPPTEPCVPPSWARHMWNTMSYEQKTTACQIGEQGQSTFYVPTVEELARQQKEQSDRAKDNLPIVSKPLAIAGFLSMAAGAGLVLHIGEENVNWFGNTYCVSDYGDVDYGSCGGPTQSQIGLILLGSGALMLWIGMRTKHVSVSPQISKTHKGVSARIRWGAK